MALWIPAVGTNLRFLHSFGVNPEMTATEVDERLRSHGFACRQEAFPSLAHGQKRTYRRGQHRVSVVISENAILGLITTRARIGLVTVSAGETEAELYTSLGRPKSRGRERRGMESLHYEDDSIQRGLGVFVRAGRVVEVHF